MNEWVVVKKFPKYEVNRQGDIRNAKSKRILHKPKDGRVISLSDADAANRNVSVARLVAEAFLPGFSDAYIVRRKDTTKGDYVENLIVSGSPNAHNVNLRKWPDRPVDDAGLRLARQSKTVSTDELAGLVYTAAEKVYGDKFHPSLAFRYEMAELILNVGYRKVKL